MEVTVSRKAHFNAAHRLNNDKWSITKNEEIHILKNKIK